MCQNLSRSVALGWSTGSPDQIGVMAPEGLTRFQLELGICPLRAGSDATYAPNKKLIFCVFIRAASKKTI
jgi:hypothetical protein